MNPPNGRHIKVNVHYKDYVRRNTLIGLLQQMYTGIIYMVSPVTKNDLGHLKSSCEVFLEFKDSIVSSWLLKVIWTYVH